MHLRLNLLLAVALFSGFWLLRLRVLAYVPGIEAGIGALAGTFVCWSLLSILMFCCIGSGGFAWLALDPSAKPYALVLGVYAAFLLLSITPISMALETPESAAGWGWSARTVAAAQLVAGLGPFLWLSYLGWLINAPAAQRDLPWLRHVWLAALASLSLLALFVSASELWRAQQKAALAISAESEAHDQQQRAERLALAALRDTDPLIRWNSYLGDDMPEDVRTEALGRLAARPTLEADLTEALESPNTLWSMEVLRLMTRLPHRPTAALGTPTRLAIERLERELRDKTGDTAGDGDRYVDLYCTGKLRSILAVAVQLAASGVDLRSTLLALQQTVVSTYPTSETARAFPREVAASNRQIADALAAAR